jgi:bifunctional non-homologous end joining protein LigD
MMPTLVAKPPQGDDWMHEAKFDGYRSQIIIEDGGVRIFTRRGLDWTAKYRDLAEAAKGLNVQNAIIDGEIIVLIEDGIPDCAALRKAITRRQHDLYFVAFDLLHLNSHDLRDMALEDRRDILAGLIEPGSRIQFSEALPGEANAIYHLVDTAGLEGMLSKRAGSKYRSGPTTNWLKTKSFTESEFELLGVERERGQASVCTHGGTGHSQICRQCVRERQSRDAGTAVEACPGTCRATAQGHAKAAGNSVGQARNQSPGEASQGRGGFAPCFAAGFLGRRNIILSAGL